MLFRHGDKCHGVSGIPVGVGNAGLELPAGRPSTCRMHWIREFRGSSLSWQWELDVGFTQIGVNSGDTFLFFRSDGRVSRLRLMSVRCELDNRMECVCQTCGTGTDVFRTPFWRFGRFPGRLQSQQHSSGVDDSFSSGPVHQDCLHTRWRAKHC